MTFDFNYLTTEVPIDWSNKENSDSITLVLREVKDPENESYSGKPKDPIVFLQGGPGFESDLPKDESWIKQLQSRYKVFLLDQRGTGLSTVIDLAGILKLSNTSHSKVIEYISKYRADSIAHDLEHIRSTFFSEQNLHTIGQSFGGFCTLTYLSLYPSTLAGCYITGGFPPIGHSAKEVYTGLIPQIDVVNKNFLDLYPHSESQLQYLVNNLEEDDLCALAQVGWNAGYDDHHYLLRVVIESLYHDLLHTGRVSTRSRQKLKDPYGFIQNPLYVLLHESIYCEETSSNWAADSIMKENGRPNINDLSKFFYGENVLKKTFEFNPELNPLFALMNTIMEYDKWPAVYNKYVLASCEVPVVGTIYENDAAVVKPFAEETASLLSNCKVIENNRDHSAYKNHTEEIFPLLFENFDELTA